MTVMNRLLTFCVSTTFVIAAVASPSILLAQGLNEPGKRLDEALGRDGGSSPSGSAPSGSGSGYGPSEEERMMIENGIYGDEYSEMGEGYEQYGYGGSSRNRRGSGTSDQLFYGMSFSAPRIDFTPLIAPDLDAPILAGPVLKRESDQAFSAGNYPLALELIFGHMVAEYPDSAVQLKTVKFNKTLGRPVWNAKFGVSYSVRGSGSPTPIRQTTTGRRSSSPSRQRNARGRGRPDEGGGYPNEMMEQEMMQQQAMMEQSMMEEPSEAEMREMMGYPEDGMIPGGPSRTRKKPTGPVRKMLSDSAQEELDENLGLVVEVIRDEFKKRFEGGNFGPALMTIEVEEEEEAGGNNNRRNGTRQPAEPTTPPIGHELEEVLALVPEPMPMWIPGVMYLGSGIDSKETIEIAREQNLDFLIHFDIALKQARNNQVQNMSRCRLYQVSTGKSMGMSKGMDNWEAAQNASSGRSGEREYVEDQMATLLSIFDRSATAFDMPALKPEHARGRISTLISGKHARSLRTLAEIRLYQAMGLISDEEVEIAFDIVGGAEGLIMLHGAPEDRIKMARIWAIRAMGGTPPEDEDDSNAF